MNMLITITNNLNTKIKAQQIRIDTMDSTFKDTQKKSQEVEERMAGFEKNMEKFIGLYEVVTNQYNPFVEAAATLEESPGGFTQSTPSVPQIPPFRLNGQEPQDLNQLSDILLTISDEDFNSQILGNKESFLNWFKEKSGNEELLTEVKEISDKNSLIKLVFRTIHS